MTMMRRFQSEKGTSYKKTGNLPMRSPAFRHVEQRTDTTGAQRESPNPQGAGLSRCETRRISVIHSDARLLVQRFKLRGILFIGPFDTRISHIGASTLETPVKVHVSHRPSLLSSFETIIPYFENDFQYL
jgi:hypothetical protein